MSDNKDSQNLTSLTEKQLHSIALLSAIPAQVKTTKKVAKKVGVSRTTLYEWRKSELYMKTWQKETQRNFRACGATMRRSLVAHAKASGNPGLFKLFFQIGEDWSEKSTVENTGSIELKERPHKGKTPDQLRKEIAEAEALIKLSEENGEESTTTEEGS